MTQQTQERTNRNSYLAITAVGILIGSLCAVPLLAMKNPLGFIVLLAVPLLVVLGLSAARRKQSDNLDGTAEALPNNPNAQSIQKVRDSRVGLALAAFLIGPITMTLIGLACELSMEMHPLDQGQIIGICATLGFIAGTVVALAIAASAVFE